MTVSMTAAISGFVPPAVLLDVTSSPSVTAPLVVWRVHEDGSRHQVITGQAVLIGGWSGTDYHAPFNQLFHYVAAAEGQAESAATPDLYLASDVTWLIHSSDPSLSLPLDVIVKLGAKKKPARGAKFAILPASADEAPLPVVRWDSRRGPESGDIVILADDDVQVQALDALLDRGPVLLNSARSEVVRWQWIDPGDTEWEPPGGYYRTPLRQLSFPWEACRAPDSDLTPLSDWSDVAAQGDWALSAAAYADWRAMNLGIES